MAIVTPIGLMLLRQWVSLTMLFSSAGGAVKACLDEHVEDLETFEQGRYLELEHDTKPITDI